MHKEYFSDGTPISEWFYDYNVPALEDMGQQYVLTDYNSNTLSYFGDDHLINKNR